MAKYNYEFKKRVVQAYLDGEGGVQYLAGTYGVPAESNIRQWINAYREYGDDGLMRSRKNEAYSFEFKLHVVELYLSTEVSYQELALSVGRIAGPDALRAKRKGRKKSLGSSRNLHPDKHSDIKYSDTNIERINQLEDELLKLKIENAY